MAASPAGMVALALVAVAGLTVVAATQLPKILGTDGAQTSSEGGAAPGGPTGGASSDPASTAVGGTTTSAASPTTLPTLSLIHI